MVGDDAGFAARTKRALTTTAVLLSFLLLALGSSASVALGAPAVTEHLYYFGPMDRN